MDKKGPATIVWGWTMSISFVWSQISCWLTHNIPTIEKNIFQQTNGDSENTQNIEKCFTTIVGGPLLSYRFQNRDMNISICMQCMIFPTENCTHPHKWIIEFISSLKLIISIIIIAWLVYFISLFCPIFWFSPFSRFQACFTWIYENKKLKSNCNNKIIYYILYYTSLFNK